MIRTLLDLIIVHMYAHVPGRFVHYVRSYYIVLEIEKSNFSKKICCLWLFHSGLKSTKM